VSVGEGKRELLVSGSACNAKPDGILN